MIRFSGLAKSSGGTSDKIITSITGFRVIRQGDDWVVPDDDERLQKGPPPVLIAEPRPINLARERYADIADLIVSHFNKEFEEFRAANPVSPKQVPTQFGLLSRFFEICDLFFFTDARRMRGILRDQVLPFMHAEFGAKMVWPVHVNASYQQGVLSLSKLSHLVETRGTEEAGKLVLQQHAMRSILPSPLDVLSYPHGLLVFSPWSIALPLSRLGCDAYFLSDGLRELPRVATSGLYQRAVLGIAPMVTRERRCPFSIHSVNIRRYFELAIQGINSLLNFLNNPLNFKGLNDEIDHQRVLMTHTSVGFMFADLISLNHTESEYVRQRIAFSFVDKLANLKAYWKGTPGEDVPIFKRLLSEEFGELIAKICGFHGRKKHPDLGTQLKKSVVQIYRSLHEHTRKNIRAAQLTEEDRLEHLRTLRNCTHGAFLKGGKFEKAFFSSDATISPDVSNLPIVLSLALALDPEEVLRS